MTTTEQPSASIDNAFANSGFQKAALQIDLPPSFDTVEDDRLYRKQRLAGALRVIGKLGLAQFTFDQSGFQLAGWFQFQPHWQDLIAEDGSDWMQPAG